MIAAVAAGPHRSGAGGAGALPDNVAQLQSAHEAARTVRTGGSRYDMFNGPSSLHGELQARVARLAKALESVL